MNKIITPIINNKYIILDKIGTGSFGSIYKGQNIRTNEYVAIKVENISENLKLLKNESIIYQYLNGCKCIPNVKWFGKDSENYYMVINLLGGSLQDSMNNKKQFTIILVLKIAIKLIEIIKTIHDKGLIHRDIKPDNFLFGLNSINDLYLIDFGFCKSYLDKDNSHIKIKKVNGLIGSLNYASINSHNRFELSRRDDLESICYMLIYFYYGALSWNSIGDETFIIELKNQLIQDGLQHENKVPRILIDLLKYTRSLTFEETPNYYFMIDNIKKEIEIMCKK